jgi:hypothetical protein
MNDRSIDRSRLFLWFMIGLFSILTLFGAGIAVELIVLGDSALASKMLNVFASMFSAVVGLGSGYLLGSSNGKKE